MNAGPWARWLEPPDRWRELTARPWAADRDVGAGACARRAGRTDRDGPHGRQALARPRMPLPRLSAAALRHVNVAAIANNHLLGSAAGAGPAAGDAANAPQTSIPLVLTGHHRSGQPGERPRHPGRERGDHQGVRRRRHHRPGGAKLHSVLSDKVILDRNGALESLMLPRQSGPPLGMTAQRRRRQCRQPRTRLSIVCDSSLPMSQARFREIMRPQPVFAQGKQRGYPRLPRSQPPGVHSSRPAVQATW